ncbi:MAG: hypothetical protein KJ648_07200 [Candidatus Omnitrophica bacterium]|nr:hypothetical protein [Candidatus Omnitrophota bacterium]
MRARLKQDVMLWMGLDKQGRSIKRLARMGDLVNFEERDGWIDLEGDGFTLSANLKDDFLEPVEG